MVELGYRRRRRRARSTMSFTARPRGRRWSSSTCPIVRARSKQACLLKAPRPPRSLALIPTLHWRSVDQLPAADYDASKENQGGCERRQLPNIVGRCLLASLVGGTRWDEGRSLRQGMIGLAAVDCSIDRKICQEYFVRRYPTVMVLHGNRKLSPRLFRGQKSLKALLGFVQVQRAPAETRPHTRRRAIVARATRQAAARRLCSRACSPTWTTL